MVSFWFGPFSLPVGGRAGFGVVDEDFVKSAAG